MADNGGAIAIKGFNYQKASIILVMIHNFTRKNFKVFPESNEDFEIHMNNKIYYIQVKGTKKITLGKLKYRPNGKPSILEKNLLPSTKINRRKIFLWDLAETTKAKLEDQPGTLVPIIHSFSSEQKVELSESLGLNQDQMDKLNNQYVYITPFTNDLNSAITRLQGEMVTANLLVTNERARLVLGELSLEIDQKSEIIMTTDDSFKRKEIDGRYLKHVFATVQQKEMFDEVLNGYPCNTIVKNKVKKIKLGIPLLYQSLKEQIKQKADINIIMNSVDDKSAIDYLRSLMMDIETGIDTELSIALAIDCFCELGEQQL
ncbi:DUF4297 domain-containing protein [Listeria sp. FSL L7-1582]|uniref:dsDNA nuclease domain-containing protein n=1 Tax=Listeria portnoyi TaxID=2713504 RepID=UPI00164E17BE|nr:dsDNA nuclease domain-containing protein [Listeria portnoyi]MBC6310000.1 DUF4297 domain-containing protein [Listeria portnoyi]